MPLNHEFVLHFDVDVINGEEFPWTNFPGAGGLSFGEVRDALRVFVSQPNLAALVVAGYNPELDADGQGARKLIDLLADVLSARLETTSAAAAGSCGDLRHASSVPDAPPSEPASATTAAPLRVPRLSLIAPPPMTCRTRPNLTQTYPDSGKNAFSGLSSAGFESNCVSCCLLR